MAAEVLIGAIGAVCTAIGVVGTAAYNRLQKKEEVQGSSTTDALKVIGDMLQRELERVHSRQAEEALRGMQRDERLDKCHTDHSKCEVSHAVLEYRVRQLESEKAAHTLPIPQTVETTKTVETVQVSKSVVASPVPTVEISESSNDLVQQH